MKLSRRDFLHLASGAVLGSVLRPPTTQPAPRPLFYGRVIFVYATIYSRPTVYAATGIIHPLEAIVPIYAEVQGEDEAAYNRRWYQTDGGFIHSSNVQPVLSHVNDPGLVSGVLLGEVTIPFVDAYTRPSASSTKAYRLYYSSTHWILRSQVEDNGAVWYELEDDRSDYPYFVPATAIRLVASDELAPLSPYVPDKQIQIDTTAETITAFEYGRPVFTTRISSGGVFEDSATGLQKDYRTPLGEYRVVRKRPSRHMAAGDLAADDAYDLPGVPWVSYFNGGMAIHGTYWHNDFGRPWSHGCINLLPQDAKWFYRWTTPVAASDQPLVESPGTPVFVV